MTLSAEKEDVFTDEYTLNAMVYDVVFIIELFWRFTLRDKVQYSHDIILAQPWLRIAIAQDLRLIENQLPFLFLQSFVGDSFKLILLFLIHLSYNPSLSLPTKMY